MYSFQIWTAWCSKVFRYTYAKTAKIGSCNIFYLLKGLSEGSTNLLGNGNILRSNYWYGKNFRKIIFVNSTFRRVLFRMSKMYATRKKYFKINLLHPSFKTKVLFSYSLIIISFWVMGSWMNDLIISYFEIKTKWITSTKSVRSIVDHVRNADLRQAKMCNTILSLVWCDRQHYRIALIYKFMRSPCLPYVNR